jgi:hypothetical protein
MDIHDYYHEQTTGKITGYVKGGIEELKKGFPKNYQDMEDNLKKNWSKAGIDQYCKSMIAGLKKIGFYHD